MAKLVWLIYLQGLCATVSESANEIQAMHTVVNNLMADITIIIKSE